MTCEFIGQGEPGVRAMRDIVYSVPTTESNWLACKEHWMRPDSIIWLLGQINLIRENDDPIRTFDDVRSLVEYLNI